MIPTTIADNFFEDPDKIVEFALKQKFYSGNGFWPGQRTEFLHTIDVNLFNFICNKILNIISLEKSKYWNFEITFQLIKPFTENQYDLRNCGWVHKDYPSIFSGVIYLNKNPEKNTGTSIYLPKCEYCINTYHESKTKNFLNQEVSNDEYNKNYNLLNSQFKESIIINNVYNRLVMFSGNSYHSAQTYGKNQERLTLVFFCNEINIFKPPILK